MFSCAPLHTYAIATYLLVLLHLQLNLVRSVHAYSSCRLHPCRSEQQEYLSQSIVWDVVYIGSNQDVIDLVDERPEGVLAILDSACRMPQADDTTFTSDLFSLHQGHHRLKRVTQMPKKTGQSNNTVLFCPAGTPLVCNL